ncbi:hypothetical protein UW610_09400, partial [Streptococcus agalactiae]
NDSSSFLLLSFSIILPYLIVDLKLCNRTDKEIFDKAEEVRDKRAKDLGRVVELAAFTSPPPKERFKMKKADNKMPVDPFERAEYLYSLIESEE